MRLATITNWAYGATVVLTIASGTAMLLASNAHKAERAAVQQRYTLDRATSRIEADVYRLTDQARQYAIDGDPSHLIVYRNHYEDLGTVEQKLARMELTDLDGAEREALEDAVRWAETLHDEQEAAIDARREGREGEALAILFGAEYERDLERVSNDVERFQEMVDRRAAAEVAAATRLSQFWQRIAEIVLIVTAGLFLCVLYFILRRRILRPVVRLSDVVTRLAAQDYAAEPPEYERIDEIGDMAQAIRIFRDNGIERQQLEKEREEEMRVRDLISRMTQRMQAAEGFDELCTSVTGFVPKIVPNMAGRLYLLDETRGALFQLCSWENPEHSRTEFPPNACWALQRGAMHRPFGEQTDIPCAHIERRGEDRIDTVCLPLSSQRETIGLLYFETKDGAETDISAASETYLKMLAENIGLAVANLRLRRQLGDMAMVDTVTGLSNRRRLEDKLAPTVESARLNDSPVSCLMLDIDHFKRFNDEFGHEAGDAVLTQVGAVLTECIRDDSMAFRYGGEEFLVLVPGLGEDAAVERAGLIRKRIAALDLSHNGRRLGGITVSAGVATAPGAIAYDAIVTAADAALLKAKEAGRDRIVVAGSGEGREVA